jgi:hypothetical protein
MRRPGRKDIPHTQSISVALRRPKNSRNLQKDKKKPGAVAPGGAWKTLGY